MGTRNLVGVVGVASARFTQTILVMAATQSVGSAITALSLDCQLVVTDVAHHLVSTGGGAITLYFSNITVGAGESRSKTRKTEVAAHYLFAGSLVETRVPTALLAAGTANSQSAARLQSKNLLSNCRSPVCE